MLAPGRRFSGAAAVTLLCAAGLLSFGFGRLGIDVGAIASIKVPPPSDWQALLPLSEPRILLVMGAGLALMSRWARKTKKEKDRP
jgi:hypothetical protein